MTKKKLVAVIDLTGTAGLKDANNLLTMVGERWHYEPELDLGEGVIRVWRTDD